MSENFEVQSKAFTVLSSVLKLYPKTSATYIKTNSDLFFNYYNEILKNGNYVVRLKKKNFINFLLIFEFSSSSLSFSQSFITTINIVY